MKRRKNILNIRKIRARIKTETKAKITIKEKTRIRTKINREELGRWMPVFGGYR